MPLYTILHHVNSFVTEWILIYLYNFLFSVFYLAIYFFTKLLLLTHFLSLSCEKAMLYCFFISSSFMRLLNFCLFVFFFIFHLKKKFSLFLFLSLLQFDKIFRGRRHLSQLLMIQHFWSTNSNYNIWNQIEGGLST